MVSWASPTQPRQRRPRDGILGILVFSEDKCPMTKRLGSDLLGTQGLDGDHGNKAEVGGGGGENQTEGRCYQP
jgi:hypothetical protein